MHRYFLVSARKAAATGCTATLAARLLTSLDWKSFLHPIRCEVGTDGQNPKPRKTHLVEGPKRGPDIRAPVPGTASAIKHDRTPPWDVLGPVLQVLESFRASPRSVEQSPGNVGAVVKRPESHTNNERFLTLGIRKLLGKIGWPLNLGTRPRLRSPSPILLAYLQCVRTPFPSCGQLNPTSRCWFSCVRHPH